jgi:hypothetical protein
MVSGVGGGGHGDGDSDGYSIFPTYQGKISHAFKHTQKNKIIKNMLVIMNKY